MSDAPTPRSARAALGYQFGLIGFAHLSPVLGHAHWLLDCHPRYALRALVMLGTCAAGLPLRVWERLRHGRRIAATPITPDPVFIIGHWRSGTTHLHNLMSQDTRYGYLSMYQAMVPGCSLVGGDWLKALLGRVIPAERPMDNMVWPMDAPQEEEIPLAKVMPYSFYARFLFPRRTPELFRRRVLLDGAPPAVAASFKRHFRRLLQVATLHCGGRPLVLKNPVNTARIPLLLEMFPNAKFVHIHRSPYEVFASTRNLYGRLLTLTTLQTINLANADAAILTLYEDMMRRYLDDRARIPAGQLAEVRFEDLERDPLGELARVYATLGLPDHTAAEPAFRAYAASQKTYRKNRLALSDADRATIEQRWDFAFDAFGYARERD